MLVAVLEVYSLSRQAKAGAFDQVHLHFLVSCRSDGDDGDAHGGGDGIVIGKTDVM